MSFVTKAGAIMTTAKQINVLKITLARMDAQKQIDAAAAHIASGKAPGKAPPAHLTKAATDAAAAAPSASVAKAANV